MIACDKLHFNYDSKYDILYLDIGEPCAAYSEEIDDGIYLRIDPRVEEPIGITIFSYKGKSKKHINAKIPFCFDWKYIDKEINLV